MGVGKTQLRKNKMKKQIADMVERVRSLFEDRRWAKTFAAERVEVFIKEAGTYLEVLTNEAVTSGEKIAALRGISDAFLNFRLKLSGLPPRCFLEVENSVYALRNSLLEEALGKIGNDKLVVVKKVLEGL